MSENMQSKPVKTTHRIRRFILYVALLLIAFLLGFVPMWLKSRACSRNLAEAERQSSLAKMQASLGSALIDAGRGDYRTAGQSASGFFTLLQAEASRGGDSALSQEQQDGAQPLLAQRDQIIAVLAQGDVDSVNLLSNLYLAYRKLVNP